MIAYSFGRAHLAADRLVPYADELLGERVSVEGKVASHPETRRTRYGEKTVFDLRITSAAGREVKAKVLCQVYRRENIRYGDRVRFEGKFQRPYDFSPRFSYREYLRW